MEADEVRKLKCFARGDIESLFKYGFWKKLCAKWKMKLDYEKCAIKHLKSDKCYGDLSQ